MKITKKEDFSLIFMSLLAKDYSKDYISLSNVATRANFSAFFLKHIANALLKKGLVESKEGINGGYRLAKHPKDISVSDILSAITSHRITPACENGTCSVSKSDCSCKGLWNDLSEKLTGYLKKISLAEFIKK